MYLLKFVVEQSEHAESLVIPRTRSPTIAFFDLPALSFRLLPVYSHVPPQCPLLVLSIDTVVHLIAAAAALFPLSEATLSLRRGVSQIHHLVSEFLAFGKGTMKTR